MTQPLTSRDKHTKLPPRWVIRAAWTCHRALLRVTGNRIGLKVPTPDRHCGAMRLHTTGRRSGRERSVVLNYIEDGDRLVTLAMNGWDPADPAWLLNLRAHPAAAVDLVGERRSVEAYEAAGEERARLSGRCCTTISATATCRRSPPAGDGRPPWSCSDHRRRHRIVTNSVEAVTR